MIRIKTAELIGPALDWAVESIEIARMRAEGEYIKEWWVAEKQTNPSPYSTDAGWAWPIIDREGISVLHTTMRPSHSWKASQTPEEDIFICEFGPTSLIAAMRCWVVSKLGDEVEIPDELA